MYNKREDEGRRWREIGEGFLIFTTKCGGHQESGKGVGERSDEDGAEGEVAHDEEDDDDDDEGGEENRDLARREWAESGDGDGDVGEAKLTGCRVANETDCEEDDGEGDGDEKEEERSCDWTSIRESTSKSVKEDFGGSAFFLFLKGKRPARTCASTCFRVRVCMAS